MKWPTARLGDVTLKIGSGATPRGGKAVYEESGPVFVRSQNVLDNQLDLKGVAHISMDAASRLAGVAVHRGDVLINITGDSIARVAQVRTEIGTARVNQHVAIIRPSAQVDGGFLQRYLVSPQSKEHLLSISQGGATRKALTKAQLENLLIPLPDLRTQRAIAEVLGSLDDKIAANERVEETATALAVALLAERSARLPLTTLAEVASLRKVQVQPAQWDTVAHFSLPAFDEGQRPAIERAADIMSTKFLIERPCVLLSKLNPRIPRIWDVSALPTLPALASTEFLVLEPHGIPSTVLWATLRLGSSLEEMVSLARGTSGSHQRVAPNEAMDLTVPDVRQLPKSDVQLLTALGHQRHAAITQQAHLAATRDALMPALMSGELSVGDLAGVPGL